MPTTDTIVSQCRALEPGVRTRCPRKAVADGLCVQHHRLKAFGIDLELSSSADHPEPTPAPVLPPAPVYAMPDQRHFRSLHPPEFYKLSDVMILNGDYHRQPYQLENGSVEQVKILERFRRAQERAWFRGGLTREQVTELFGAWPTQFGYPAYEWHVGDPPVFLPSR